jgi:H+-translocating NAD(P) transhydrogenase subunit alpha
MKISVIKETHPHENRCACIPAEVARYTKLGLSVLVESGIGQSIGYTDEDYVLQGAEVSADRNVIFAEGDIVLTLRAPSLDDAKKLKTGSLLIGYLDPKNNYHAPPARKKWTHLARRQALRGIRRCCSRRANLITCSR